MDCKEIQPVHSKGDQPWDFFGRNDTKAETPVLWPPHVKSWLLGKDSDAGRDWGQEEKGTTEDEMAGWHHWLDGRESEWTPGVGDGQGGLACCDSWGHRVRHNWATELNWTELKQQFMRPLHFYDPLDYMKVSLKRPLWGRWMGPVWLCHQACLCSSSLTTSQTKKFHPGGSVGLQGFKVTDEPCSKAAALGQVIHGRSLWDSVSSSVLSRYALVGLFDVVIGCHITDHARLGTEEWVSCQSANKGHWKPHPYHSCFFSSSLHPWVLNDSLQHSLRRGWCGCGSCRLETRPAHPGGWEHRDRGIKCWLLSVVIYCTVATKGRSRNVAIRIIQLFGNLHLCASMENSFVLICGVFSCFKIQWHLIFRFCLIFMFLVSLCRAGTFKSPFSAIFGKGQTCIVHDLGSIALKAPFLLVGVFWVMN